MNHQRSRICQLFGAVVVVGIAGLAIGAPSKGAPSKGAASRGSAEWEVEKGVEIEPIEWVEISIHMPDGRVIKSREHRFPSRSRVLMLTGKLPVLKRGGGQVDDAGVEGSATGQAEVSTDVDDTGVAGEAMEGDGGESLGGLGAVASAASGSTAGSAGSVGSVGSVGSSATGSSSSSTSSSSGSSGSSSEASGAGGGTGAVRSFKKSS